MEDDSSSKKYAATQHLCNFLFSEINGEINNLIMKLYISAYPYIMYNKIEHNIILSTLDCWLVIAGRTYRYIVKDQRILSGIGYSLYDIQTAADSIKSNTFRRFCAQPGQSAYQPYVSD
jgi:hypothetical protein